jgi:serine/threonine protein kinase
MLGDSGFTKIVALKVLNPDMASNKELSERLRDEARLLGLLRHRAIVQVDGLTKIGGQWAVVMEYVDGVDLKRILIDHGRMPPGPALEIIGEIAGALHIAYTSKGPGGTQLKLLHRDIKPANIRITQAGEVKILDFGVARADFESREAKTENLAFGSGPYMAPERLDFIDTRGGDIYSLGCVLFELLTGQRHGRTSSKKDRHLALLLKNVNVLRETLGKEHEKLVDLVRALLAYEPTDRPLARDVERHCMSLRVHYPAMSLRDWCEATVTELMQSAESPEIGPLEGANLVLEGGGDGEIPTLATAMNLSEGQEKPSQSTKESDSNLGTTPAPVAFRSEDPAPSTWTSWKGWVLAGVLIALLAGASQFLGGQQEAAPDKLLDPTAVEASETVGGSDAADSPEVIENAPAPVVSPVRATPRRRVESEPVVAPPDSPPDNPAMGQVVLTGSDAQKVILSKKDGTTVEAPATLPVGTWNVIAHFPDGVVPVGTVSILEGRTTTISCNAAFQTCKKD